MGEIYSIYETRGVLDELVSDILRIVDREDYAESLRCLLSDYIKSGRLIMS